MNSVYVFHGRRNFRETPLKKKKRRSAFWNNSIIAISRPAQLRGEFLERFTKPTAGHGLNRQRQRIASYVKNMQMEPNRMGTVGVGPVNLVANPHEVGGGGNYSLGTRARA